MIESSDWAVVELRNDSLCMDTFDPAEDIVETVAGYLARNGDTSVPGFAVIPETSHLIGTREKLNLFIFNLLDAVVGYWQVNNPQALSPVRYLSSEGKRTENYYSMSRVRAHESELIGVSQTSFFLHSDFLRIQYSAISYGRFENVEGGKLRLFDALKLKEDTGTDLMDLVVAKVPANKSGTLNDHQYYYIAKSELDDEFPNYTRHVTVNSSKMPLIVVSNKFETDGLLHGPTRIRKLDKNLPVRRPSYLASISAEYLSADQMAML